MSTDATATTRHNIAATRLTFGGLLKSEWIKLRTLRSTVWCFIIIVAVTIGIGLLVAGVQSSLSGTNQYAFEQDTWLSSSALGVRFTELVSAVLGALVITGEYGTGMIRSTFAAAPNRVPAVIAKALVFGVTTFVIQLVALVITALLAAAILNGKGYHPDLRNVHVWLGLVGAAGYIALIGIIALGLGLIIRNSAGGIATALGLVLVVPTIFTLLGALTRTMWPLNVGSFLPSSAGTTLYSYPVPAGEVSTTAGLITLNAGEGFLVLLGWCVLVLALGLILVKRRDA